MRKLLLLIPTLIFCGFSFSQGTFVPLGSDAYSIVDRMDIKYSRIASIIHTGDKSYLRGDVAKFAETILLSNLRFNKVQQYQLQWLADDNAEWLDSLQSKTRRPLWKVLYTEPASFLKVSSKKKGLFDLRFNPVFSMGMGAESYQSRFIFSSARGVEVRGNIKKVFSFYFNVLGNAERLPEYGEWRVMPPNMVKNYNPYLYVPGQSYWKDYSSKLFKFNDGIDYFDARGYINVNLLKYINISFGRDKFFIGNGQRSLFLSDYSAPYLFLKFDVSFWRVKYQSILAELNSQYIRGADQLLPKKYLAVHHLSIQATHNFNFGLFEGVVLSRSNHFELQYLNPIIFYRAVEHAIGSPDNVLLGADMKLNLIDHMQIYGQLLLDEFNFKHFFSHDGWWANKFGVQAGLKYIDIVPNLDAQLEVNVVRPFTYTHPESINYTNYNQPLAHPLGANFYEIIMQVHYQPIPQLAFNLKYWVAKVGDDTLINGSISNYGSNLFLPSYGGTSVSQELGNRIGQGAKGTINYIDFTASYQPWHNIYFDLDMLYRSKSSKLDKSSVSYGLLENQSSFIFNIGLRLNIAMRKLEF